jgi:lysozyme
MLWELLSKLFRPNSSPESTQKSSESSASSVSSPAQSRESSGKVSWIDIATKQIRFDEGEVLHAYTDTMGWLTIGVGRLIDQRKGGGISKDESEYLLRNDINSRVAALQSRISWFNGLDDARKGVLLNMSFQMGVEGLMGFHTTLARIKEGDCIGAAESMMQSKWATQTPARAKRLAQQMRTGKWIFG